MYPHFFPSFYCATVLAIIVREIGSDKVLNWKELMKCGFVEAPYFAWSWWCFYNCTPGQLGPQAQVFFGAVLGTALTSGF
jgi:hypothetical protein